MLGSPAKRTPQPARRRTRRSQPSLFPASEEISEAYLLVDLGLGHVERPSATLWTAFVYVRWLSTLNPNDIMSHYLVK